MTPEEIDAFVASLPEEDLRSALHAAAENINILEDVRDTLIGERDKARVELQRLRERSSLELAEAKVEAARISRKLNEVVRKLHAVEAERDDAAALVIHYSAVRLQTAALLTRIAEAMEAEPPEA